MANRIDKQTAIKELGDFFTVALTAKTARDRIKQNRKVLLGLKQKKLHTGCFGLMSTDIHELNAVINWSEPWVRNDIRITIYLNDEVIRELICDYDPEVIAKAYKMAATPYNRHFADRVDDVHSVESFLGEYYKPDRFTDTLIDTYTKEFERFGFCLISKHDSRTGSVVAYYG